MSISNVVRIADARPHLAGPARCLNCKHEREAVAPIGCTSLDCPACGAMLGGRFSMVLPEEGCWHCNCGNCFFVLTESRWMCPNCGLSQVFPNG